MIHIKYARSCLTFSFKNTRRLDFSISDILKEKIEKKLSYQVNNYILDLGDIHFIDSHSFTVLLQVHNMLDNIGKKLFLVNVSENAKELFELTGLHTVLTIIMQDTPYSDIAC